MDRTLAVPDSPSRPVRDVPLAEARVSVDPRAPAAATPASGMLKTLGGATVLAFGLAAAVVAVLRLRSRRGGGPSMTARLAALVRNRKREEYKARRYRRHRPRGNPVPQESPAPEPPPTPPRRTPVASSSPGSALTASVHYSGTSGSRKWRYQPPKSAGAATRRAPGPEAGGSMGRRRDRMPNYRPRSGE